MMKGSGIGYSRAPYTCTVNILNSSETSVLFYQFVRRHIPEKLSLKVTLNTCNFPAYRNTVS
jgi:hypothetical protein